MIRRIVLTGFAVCALAATAARADTIVTSSSAFPSNATETTSLNLPYYSNTNSITLGDGTILAVNGDEVAASGSGFAPFTDGYTGDILITNGASETISFTTPITALGFYVAPDVGIDIPNYLSNAVLTITLSNGQSTNVSMSNFAAGAAQFVGFYGTGDVNAITISVSGTNGFGGSIADFAFGDFFSVPEPASLAALASGVLALGLLRRKRTV